MKKTLETSDDIIPEGFNRVTEVLSPYKDFSQIRPEILTHASERGDLVHRFCELYALDLLIEIPSDEVNKYLNSFKLWFDEFVSEVICTEERLNHVQLRLSGRYDLLVKMKGSDQVVLVDYKTPSQSDRTWNLQTACYMFLLRELRDLSVDRRICLMLDSEGNYPRVIEYTKHKEEERLYLNQLELFRFFNPIASFV
jgi:hypothetical protein